MRVREREKEEERLRERRREREKERLRERINIKYIGCFSFVGSGTLPKQEVTSNFRLLYAQLLKKSL